MAKSFERLEPKLTEFLLAQKVFFVATAPLSGEGSVNLSPKGLDSLRVIDAHTVAYLDYPGSGVETIAHLRENGRIVLMVCAFEGPPQILRVHGRGRVVEPQDPEFSAFVGGFSPAAPPRSIILIDVQRVSTACGYGVPYFEFKGERDQITKWSQRKGEQGVLDYQKAKNGESVDALPGLRWVKP